MRAVAGTPLTIDTRRVRSAAGLARLRVRAHPLDARLLARRRRRRGAGRRRLGVPRLPQLRLHGTRPSSPVEGERTLAGFSATTRDPPAVAVVAGGGPGAALPQLGVRAGGVRPCAAPGRPLAARRARAGAEAGARSSARPAWRPAWPIEPARLWSACCPGARSQARRGGDLGAGARRGCPGAPALVDIIDFKGQDGFLQVKDPQRVAATLYDDVLRALPDADLDGPATTCPLSCSGSLITSSVRHPIR